MRLNFCSVPALLIRAFLWAEPSYFFPWSSIMQEKQRSEKCPISPWRHCSPQFCRLSNIFILSSLSSLIPFHYFKMAKRLLTPRGIERQRKRWAPTSGRQPHLICITSPLSLCIMNVVTWVPFCRVMLFLLFCHGLVHYLLLPRKNCYLDGVWWVGAAERIRIYRLYVINDNVAEKNRWKRNKQFRQVSAFCLQ